MIDIEALFSNNRFENLDERIAKGNIMLKGRFKIVNELNGLKTLVMRKLAIGRYRVNRRRKISDMRSRFRDVG